MSTSDKELLLRVRGRWFAAAFFCAVFSLVYEYFSHGVMSLFMVGMFLAPLLLGAGAAALLLRFATRCPDLLARQLWLCGTVTWTLASCLAGVFEIYGAPAPLVRVHWFVGGALLVLALLRYALYREDGGECATETE